MESTPTDRLKGLLKGLPNVPFGSEIRALTPDASTREYFRIDWDGSTAIACVYPQDEPGAGQFAACLDVTGLFLSNSLPVARVLYSNDTDGVIIHEDFGDTILRDVLQASDDAAREVWIDRAIALIAQIQAATSSAYARNSIASRLSFDFEKLSWELDFFRQHYFTTLKGRAPESAPAEFVAEMNAVARELAGMASVLTHRDFHAANLMLSEGELKIIDHQDARIGPTSYDLVSLLLDRVTEAPSANWLAGKRKLLL
ncbi:MAG TPA: phosphotransferase, partial [Pyrinomonadaceae bacterium]|nr:phosphotransferase [Pyrinomonadaceae bacterium]